MRILVTGGAGYIGSIAVEMLKQSGYEISVLDDCSTGHSETVPHDARFVEGSLLRPSDVADALIDCDAVMHFAGKSLVEESVEQPELYWEVNVAGGKTLLDQMRLAGISKIVFSSSAATYGDPGPVPIRETSTTYPTNPYGETKLAFEAMLTEASREWGLAAASLRYFNVAGALFSDRGWLSERHSPETHLIPNVLRSDAANPIKIYGANWPTPDGTCVRDYVHVVDLVEAHIRALNCLIPEKHQILNLGSGKGYSVREVIRAVANSKGVEVESVVSARRPGDPAVLIADISKARKELDWLPVRDIDWMVSDALSSLGN